MGRIARTLFGIPDSEVGVARRGFRVDRAEVAERLEAIGAAFVSGYHAALETQGLATLERALERAEHERRGFAYEGAAMGLAVRDALAPWRPPRWRVFLDGPGAAHAYMVHVGAGWAMARLGRLAAPVERALDPMLRALAYDGFGFHEAYFHAARWENGLPAPRRLSADERHAFDQGLGRGFWFVEGADPGRVVARLERFAAERRDDLWAGVGLACAYAGGADRAALGALRAHAGAAAAWLAQGASFAAKARLRAGNPAPHTRAACEALAGLDDAGAARITDQALARASGYEDWRRRIRDRFASDEAGARRAPAPTIEGATAASSDPAWPVVAPTVGGGAREAVRAPVSPARPVSTPALEPGRSS